MKIGYARVSTDDQDLKIQIQKLTEAGCKKIYEEKISGSQRQRPQLESALNHLREEDTFVVWRLDRLARSTKDLLEIMEIIKSVGASFLSLSEPWADTTSHAGRMIMTVFAGVAEFEKDLIRERTGLGRAAAKNRGVEFGRPKKLTADQSAMILKLIENGHSVKEVANSFGVHYSTLYRMIPA
ncbi:recombinase family protein [Candidatus Bealeia paramacronuclearis]